MPKLSENQYINTFNKDNYKKISKNVQDPNRDLLDPKVEFVHWRSYFV